MAANRDRAAKDIAAGVEALRKAAPPNKPMPRELLEAQLLQAEIALDAGDGKGAAVLFQPLVDAVKAEGLKTLDNVTIRIFLGGIRAYIAINDLEKAGKVSGLLVESGPDTPAVNSVLLNFAKILSQQRRETAKAAEIEVDPTKHQALLDQVASMDDLLQKLLGNLGKRKELSTHADLAAKGALWIADALTQVGQEDAAAEQIKICQQRAKEDPQWNAIVSKGVTYLRTKLVQAQAQKGKYPEAIKQIDALIAEHDRALEPKMTKGRILQEWAQKDPSHFKEALMHWEDLREKLERMKVKPGEFFDVTYYEAVCVENEALNLKKKGDREGAAKEALKAEKLLQSTLVRNSKLETTEETKKKEGQGVERRKQYKVLMDRLEILQGRQPVPEKKSR
jgi:tetratricopeptide (TPR) repeat protein